MAAMRGRRPPPPGHPARRGRKAPPPPRAIPRLAAIKMSGGLNADDVQVTGKSLLLALGGLVMICGVAVAGAAWMGDSLFDVREAMARSTDAAAANVGFEVNDIEIAGVSGARAEEVRAVILPEGRRSVLSLDPADVKARIEGLGWVQRAQVRRLWPSTLRVHVERRQAYARWQENGEIAVIDANGERLLAERAADHADLPLVVGRGAGHAAEPVLVALEDLPEVRMRLRALVRVGERRWNVELASGLLIALPEQGAPDALAQLEALHREHRLLDRPLAQLDLRAPGRMAVRVHPPLAGARAPLLGGA